MKSLQDTRIQWVKYNRYREVQICLCTSTRVKTQQVQEGAYMFVHNHSCMKLFMYACCTLASRSRSAGNAISYVVVTICPELNKCMLLLKGAGNLQIYIIVATEFRFSLVGTGL